jgi:hypothetical protein
MNGNTYYFYLLFNDASTLTCAKSQRMYLKEIRVSIGVYIPVSTGLWKQVISHSHLIFFQQEIPSFQKGMLTN